MLFALSPLGRIFGLHLGLVFFWVGPGLLFPVTRFNGSDCYSVALLNKCDEENEFQ